VANTEDPSAVGAVDPAMEALNALPPIENIDENTLREERVRKKHKKQQRKGRDPESHDEELNIVALMDAFTIILVFLIKSYASDPTQITMTKELEVPKSTSVLSVVEAVPLAITRSAILVADKPVLRLNDGAVDATAKQNMFVSALHQALKDEAEKQKLIQRYNSKVKFEGLLLIIADRRTPFQTLTEVLYTAGQAEFAQYKFAVLKLE